MFDHASARQDRDYRDSIHRTLERGLAFLASRQGEDGSWRGEYGGPMFLLPMYVATCAIAGIEIPGDRREGLVAYIRSVQNADGGVGLHEEDDGAMFTSALCYVALRLLDVPRDDPDAARMRRWILANGTALGAASWGKFTLALLNLYPWEGIHPVLPELWLLPEAAPIHPHRLWCHCRQVYLPMSYLYGVRARVDETGLTRELRADLYDSSYDRIDFEAHRDTVAPCDNRFPASRVLRAANRLMGAFERRHPGALRKRSIEKVYQHVCFEDEVTHYIDIGPVNSLLNTLVHHFREPGGERFERSAKSLEEYVCACPEGVKFNGYNSTAVWDTVFAAQAIRVASPDGGYQDTLARAYAFLRDNQILEDVPDHRRHYRHPSRGGWPFSDRAHGWPITDCTSEGFKAVVALEQVTERAIDEDLLAESVDLILSFQNRDGGWSTYERKRGGDWLELLNPSQVFGDIMVDYSYVECTSACIQALALARRRFPGRFDQAIDRAVRRGVDFIRARQRPDGGFEGSWAVCFTYGTWFGVWGLLAGGVPVDAPEIQRACGFLIQVQNPDGGWGESHLGCMERRYVRAERSRAVHTAWALLALVRAGLADTASARRAARFLVDCQRDDGDWPREPLVGVFNKSTLIDYENYRRYFPIWALAEFERAFGDGAST